MVEPAPDAAKTRRQVNCAGDGSDHAPASPTLFIASSLPALFGVLLVLTITARHGPGVTPDSVSYLSAARSLLAGEGFRGPDGEAYVAFPPLFPALIATTSLGMFDPVDAATALVAVSFGVTILATGWLAGRITGSAPAAVAAALAVLLSTPVLDAALHIWSELLFMAFSALGLGALAIETTRPTTRRTMATATITAALASLTRYVGVTLTLTQILTASARPGATAVSRLRAAGVALIGLIPLLLWLIRNWLVSGTPAGERYPAATSFAENARAAIEALLIWLVPLNAPMRFHALLLLLAVALVLAVVAPPAIHGRSHNRRLLWACMPLVAFCSLYLLYLVLAASVTALDPIDDRLIAPLLPPAIVLVFALGHGAVSLHGPWQRTGQIVALVLLCLWLTVSAGDTIRLVRRAASDGVAGYADATWQRSETLAALRTQPPSGMLYSNDPFAIAYHTEREARLSPRRHPYRSPGTAVDDIPSLQAALASGDEVFLVWFDGVPRDFLFSPGELAMILELQPVARFDDGAVYRLR
ncbi:MAG: hypothetical protein AB7R89_05000 [Dehalococcoidia bacterium]